MRPIRRGRTGCKLQDGTPAFPNTWIPAFAGMTKEVWDEGDVGGTPAFPIRVAPAAFNERRPVSEEIDRDRTVIGWEAPAGIRILIGPYDLPERRLVHPSPCPGAEYEEVDRVAMMA